MDDNTKFLENLIKENKDISLANIVLHKGNDCFYMLNDEQHINIFPRRDIYSFTFLYNIENIVSKNDFNLFFKESFPNVITFSKIIMDGLKVFHKTIVENIEKLVCFTDNPLQEDACKGNATIIFDMQNQCFNSIVMTGLLSCTFKLDFCFYNIKYTYENPKKMGLVISKNSDTKAITQFSNNVFIYLVDRKMNEILTDIHVEYTAEQIKHLKLLYNMLTI